MDTLQIKTLLFDLYVLVIFILVFFLGSGIVCTLSKVGIIGSVAIDFLDIRVYSMGIKPNPILVKVVEALDYMKVILCVVVVIIL